MSKNAKIILNLINKTTEHPTAEELYMKMIEEDKRVSMATIYNNLNALCDRGQIKRLVMENTPDRFDRSVRHDHLICTSCRKITDVFLDDLKDKIEESVSGDVSAYELKIYCVCENCK